MVAQEPVRLKTELQSPFNYFQRVSKLVKSLTYAEIRVDALVDIWGKKTLQDVEVVAVEDKTEDEKLLHGLQLEGEGISQDDIDKLFD